ncbi:structural maintenance of chromosome protein [Pelomyxa schiedti]|nr:structural maintenance of chromosome protein [Pelomyxa schiedti]
MSGRRSTGRGGTRGSVLASSSSSSSGSESESSSSEEEYDPNQGRGGSRQHQGEGGAGPPREPGGGGHRGEGEAGGAAEAEAEGGGGGGGGGGEDGGAAENDNEVGGGGVGGAVLGCNSHAECGILEKLELENFMCHERLELAFGPHVNFVVGVNGSGKSALLIAISLCLGAKATFSQRGTALKTFIKSGASSATVRVKIRNRGAEAFKPDVFGKSIFIERKWTIDGPTTYKLKEASGKRIVGSTLNEVVEVLEYFSIQVSNPCVILMQDTARQFLTDFDPKKLYQFFLMATQLEKIKEDYNSIAQHSTEIESKLATKKKLLPMMRTKVEELKKDYEYLKELKNQESHLKELKNELAWAFVVEKKQLVLKAEGDLKAVKEGIVKMQEHANKLQEKANKCNDDVTEKSKELNEITKQLALDTKELQNNEQKLASLKRASAAINSKARDLQKRIEHLRKRRENVEHHIMEVKQHSAQDISSEKEARQGLITKKQDQIEELKKKKATIETEVAQIQHEIEEAKRQLDTTATSEHEIDTRCNKTASNIKNYENQKSDRIRVFGERVPEILKLIAANRKMFQHEVLGPIGNHMQLTDDKWATAIEAAIGDALSAFVVGSSADFLALKQLLQHHNISCPVIFTQTYQSYPYTMRPDHLPPPSLLTINNAIQTNNPNVKNLLVDQKRIESMVLCEDRDSADRFLDQYNTITDIYLPSGSRMFLRNGSRAYVANKKRNRQIFGINIDERIRECQEQLQLLRQQKAQIAPEKAKQTEHIKNLSAAAGQRRARINPLVQQIATLEEEIKELMSVREEKQADVGELEENVANLTREITEKENELSQVEQSHKQTVPEQQPLELEKNKLQYAVAQLSEKNTECETVVKRLMVAAEKISNNLLTIEKEKGVMNQQVSAAEDALTKTQQEYETTRAQAFQLSPVEQTPEKTPRQLNTEIGNLAKSIEREKAGRKNIDEARKQFTEANTRWKETERMCATLQTLSDKVKQQLAERQKKWDKMLRSIARRTSVFFSSFLSQKGYSGRLVFDHRASTLSIVAQVNSLNTGRAVTDTKSLSGGERAFSTTALLLALWEAMECPLRAMDEFDVFMDAVNREIAVHTLIKSTSFHKNRQFFLFTPNTLPTDIRTSEDLRIFKLSPPKKGQCTLNFQPAADT